MAFDYFRCYHSYLKKCEKLTDQELGRLFRALMEYSNDGERQELAGRESIAFDFIADDIDREKAEYDSQCRQNAENGRKGGRPKQKPTAFEKSEGFLEKPSGYFKNRLVLAEREKEKEERTKEEKDKEKDIKKDLCPNFPDGKFDSPPDGDVDGKANPKHLFEQDSKPYKLAAYLARRIRERLPSRKPFTETCLQSWALDFDRLNRIDGHGWRDIAAVLDFSQSDSFWRLNILSAGKFRKQYDRLWLQMREEEDRDGRKNER